MMKHRLVPLVLVAAVLCAGAWWVRHRAPARGAQPAVGARVLPNLPLDRVSRIAIRSASATVTLARVSDRWTVAERSHYPADFTKLRDFVQKLADLKVRQPMRVAPDQFGDLGLLAPGGAATAGAERVATTIALQDDAGKTLAELRVGKSRMRSAGGAPGGMDMGGGYPDGRYVARGDGEVFLVAETLDDATAPLTGWLDPTFVDLASTDIESIEVTGPDRAAVLLRRQANGDFLPPAVATNKEPDTYKIGRVTGALSGLRFADVAGPADASNLVAALANPIVFAAHARDGRTVTVRLAATATNGADRLATVAIAYTPPPEPPAPPAGTNAAAIAEAQKKQAEAKAAREKTAADARTLQAHLAPWVYTLASYNVEAMLTPAAELVKDKPAPTNAVPATVTAPKTVAKAASPDRHTVPGKPAAASVRTNIPPRTKKTP